MKVDVIYERGVLRIINPAEIDTDEINVHIVNRDEILTEPDLWVPEIHKVNKPK